MASTYSSLNVHIVFATKDRALMIDAKWRREFHAYVGGTVRALGAKPYNVGGVADHVHILAGLKTTHCVADLVRDVKRAASTWASDHAQHLAWQNGYGAFSVAASGIPAVMQYIDNQEEHHRQVSSADELRALLIEFGVEFDEQYFE